MTKGKVVRSYLCVRAAQIPVDKRINVTIIPLTDPLNQPAVNEICTVRRGRPCGSCRRGPPFGPRELLFSAGNSSLRQASCLSGREKSHLGLSPLMIGAVTREPRMQSVPGLEFQG